MSALDSVDVHQQLIQALIADLARRYPGESPRLVQTHISSVVLVGTEAYKLKRPVCYPFVDFSTLEKRRYFCEEELRINRRTAPDLYLEVIPITGTLEAPRIGASQGVCATPRIGASQGACATHAHTASVPAGALQEAVVADGSVLEWALHMRRFPDDGLLSTQARQGRLDVRQIDNLAAHLADFHQGLPALLPSELAHFASMSARVADNLAEVAPMLIAQQLDLPNFEHCSAAIRRWASTCDAAMPARQRDGFFREGHGDLHLANLVAIDGQVIAFDAIEFDPALRCIDVINDLAFAYMDLLAFRQPALAWRLVSGYLERTGDYAGLTLLDGYAANRALVRGKVALLSGAPTSEVQRYFELAGRLLEPGPPPVLVLVSGVSGSGKSTFANLLAPRLSAVRVRADVERKRLFKQGKLPLGEGLYSPAATQHTYARLAQIADEGLRAGVSLVIDATFLETAYFERFTDLARQRGLRLEIFECTATAAAMRDRLIARANLGDDPSDATPEVLASQLARKETSGTLPANLKVHDVRNTGTLAELDALALEIARSILNESLIGRDCDILMHTISARKP